MPGRYRYNPCNNCCRTECDVGSTFVRVTVTDSCLSPNGPLVGATVSVQINSTGEEVGNAVTGVTGIVDIPITKWTTYKIVVTKANYAQDLPPTFTISNANCGAIITRSVAMSRIRIQAVSGVANVGCGWDNSSGLTGTVSQAGSASMTVNADIIHGGSTDTGQAWFYFYDANLLPNVPIIFTVNNPGPYSPSSLSTTTTLNNAFLCVKNSDIDHSVSSLGSVTWNGRGCPNLPTSSPTLNTGYVCTPFGQVPAVPPPPNTAKNPCSMPWQVGDFSVNDPQVGGGSLAYKGCFGPTNPDGTNYKGKTGMVWEGTVSYNSPGCSTNCTGICVCAGLSCFGGTFPGTTATVTYLLSNSSFSVWELQITSTARVRCCGSSNPSPTCCIAQFADGPYTDTTLNPPIGITFPANHSSSNGGFLTGASCPPGIVLEFACSPFVPQNASDLFGQNPCEYPKPNRTVTVTA
jgi:hypothetical protein